jgi:hypothetical protein
MCSVTYLPLKSPAKDTHQLLQKSGEFSQLNKFFVRDPIRIEMHHIVTDDSDLVELLAEHHAINFN